MWAEVRLALITAGIDPLTDRIVVGVSGGRDSVCLLHVLATHGVKCIAACLDHLQRPEAKQEVNRVRELAQRLGAEFVSAERDVPALAREERVSLEHAGRIARREFLSAVATQNCCPAYLVAHTRDDLVETVLFRIARGTGLNGLDPFEQGLGAPVRPLVDISRAQTLAYCHEHGLEFHDDPANEDRHHARATLRHDVLPLLFSINSSADQHIADLAGDIREVNDLLCGLAWQLIADARRPSGQKLGFVSAGDEAFFDWEPIRAVHPAIAKRALFTHFPVLWHRKHIAILFRAMQGGDSGSITHDGFRAEWNSDILHVRRITPGPFVILGGPNAVVNYSIGVHLSEPEQVGLHECAPNESAVDSQSIPVPLSVGYRQPSDVLTINGVARPLGQWLAKRPFTPYGRQVVPVIRDQLGPIWVGGLGVDDRARAKPGALQRRIFMGTIPEVIERTEN